MKGIEGTEETTHYIISTCIINFCLRHCQTKPDMGIDVSL